MASSTPAPVPAAMAVASEMGSNSQMDLEMEMNEAGSMASLPAAPAAQLHPSDELWIFQCPGITTQQLSQQVVAILNELQYLQEGTCFADQGDAPQLLVKAVQAMCERMFAGAGYLKFGNSFLAPLSQMARRSKDVPMTALTIPTHWNGSSLYFQIHTDLVKFRALSLHDLSSAFARSVPVYLCPPGLRVVLMQAPTILPSVAKDVLDSWIFHFGLDPEFLGKGLEFGMPPVVTCFVKDKPLLVPTKCLLVFSQCETSSLVDGHSQGFGDHFWMTNFVLQQKLFSDPTGGAQCTPFPWLIPDSLNFAPLDPLTKGDKLWSQHPSGKMTILEFSSKYQPKIHATPSTPQTDNAQARLTSSASFQDNTTKMSANDMKLEDLDSQLGLTDLDNELFEFYSEKPPFVALSSPAEPPQASEPGGESTSASTPSVSFTGIVSPSVDQTSAGQPSQGTLQASSSTPAAMTSPMFSPAALQDSQMGGAVQTPVDSSASQFPATPNGPLPSERHVRPNIYSPLNILVSPAAPRFSPAKPPGTTGQPSSFGPTKGSSTPLTPGSEPVQSDDDSSSSDNDEDDDKAGGGQQLAAVKWAVSAEEAAVQQEFEQFSRTVDSLAQARPTFTRSSPARQYPLSPDLLSTLRQHVQGTFDAPQPAGSRETLALGTPFRTRAPEDVAFQAVLQAQALLAPLAASDSRKGPVGPFTFSQLAEAIETENGTSQYDKNPRFRRKRKAESNVESLFPPDVLLGHEETWLKTSATALPFWEKASLVPYGAQKAVRCYSLLPKHPNLPELLGTYLRDLGSVYELCGLGTHQAGPVPHSGKSLIEISMDAVSVNMPEEEKEEIIRGAYLTAALSLGNALQSINSQVSRDGLFVVVYVVSPYLGEGSSVFLSEIFSKLVSNVHSSPLKFQLVLQLVSIEALVGHTPQRSLSAHLRDVAFSVYSKCRPYLRGFSNTREDYALFSPAFILARSTLPKVQYNLLSQPAVYGWERLLHVAYQFSQDCRWMATCWTDERGELLETDLQQIGESDADRQGACAKLWKQCNVLTKSTSFPWRIVLCKVGTMTSQEAADWTSITHEYAEHVRNPSPIDRLAVVSEYDNINSVSVCWAASCPHLQIFDSFFSSLPSAAKKEPAPPSPSPQPCSRIFVATPRVSFAEGAAPPLSNGLICNLPNTLGDSPGLPWSRSLEVSLVLHLTGSSIPASSNSAYRTWSGEAVSLDSVNRDICLQFHALSYLGRLPPLASTSVAPSLSTPSPVPLHIHLVKRMLSLSRHLLPVHSEQSPTRAATHFTPPPHSIPRYE